MLAKFCLGHQYTFNHSYIYTYIFIYAEFIHVETYPRVGRELFFQEQSFSKIPFRGPPKWLPGERNGV
jgi:hypothetical protein